MAAHPDLPLSVRANRAFLARTVRWLARGAGIRQFLDVGTGIPAADNTPAEAASPAPCGAAQAGKPERGRKARAGSASLT
jgi:S-adenosyl methyltransferase